MNTLHLPSLQPKPTRSKAPSIHLTDAQKWAVAKYCIENRGIIQDKDGKFTIYRVGQSQLAKEVSDALFKINNNHIASSMSFYNIVCELTDNLPMIPAHESVQEEILKIEIEKLRNDLKLSQDELMKAAILIKNYKDRIAQILMLTKIS